MLKKLSVVVLLVTLVSGAILDDYLPAEHRRGDDVGIPLSPETPIPAADSAEDPAASPAVDANIEAELETQLRDSLPAEVLTSPDQPLYRPLYTALWRPYPAPYLLPAVYSAAGRPLGPPVSWYAAQVRSQRPLLYPGLIGPDQPAPSVAASRFYDVTISSAHAPQLAE